MRKIKTRSLFDYFVVIALPLVATIITIQWQTNQVISLFLFFILPAL